MTGWFGESWGAPVNEDGNHIDTPVGEHCVECGVVITDGDQGFVIPHLGDEGTSTYHKACFFKTLGITEALSIERWA